MITTIVEAVEMMGDFVESRSGPLGINFVGRYEESRIPKYPAVVIAPGPRDKEIHAQQTFQIALVLDLYVYHGDITLTKRERSKEDLQLVANLERELETDYEFREDPDDPATKRIIFGYVATEAPGIVQPRSNKSNLIVCTRMTWRGLTQRRFTHES